MLEIDVSLFITGVNNSIDIGTFYERLLNVGTFEILDPSFNANVKAAVIIDTVSAYGESDYSIKNNTSAFVKLKFYKPPVPYQPNEKYILDIQQNFINIDGEPRLTQGICSIQIPTYITMDYPKSLKIMTSPDFDPSFNYMTGSYYITPHLTAMPAYPAPEAELETTSNLVEYGSEIILTPTFSYLFGGTASISDSSFNIISDIESEVPQPISPTRTTTYTLTATNIRNVSATASQPVTVTYPNPTASLTASPSEVQSGGSVTLTPTFSNLFGGTASISDGSSNILTNLVSDEAVSAPAITTTTTYTLTATNISNASAIATQTVTVVAPPSAGFNGNITVSQNGSAPLIYIMVYADGTERFNQSRTNFTTITFPIGTQLLSESSYLYMRVFPAGTYSTSSSGFSTVGVSFIGYEDINGSNYQKYSVSSTLTNATLLYNISTYDND